MKSPQTADHRVDKGSALQLAMAVITAGDALMREQKTVALAWMFLLAAAISSLTLFHVSVMVFVEAFECCARIHREGINCKLGTCC